MQSHFDHTADLARIAEETGAKTYATASDARVLEDGGFSDPHFGSLETFVDPEGFVDAIENLEAIYRLQLRQETKKREAATDN